MRNLSVERMWTVSDCKWMCVKGGMCVILSLEQFEIFPTHHCFGVRYLWVCMRSLCIEYAWLSAGHASAVSAYASELVGNCARPSTTPHVHITHEPRTYHVYSTDIHWQSLTKLEHLQSVRVWTHSVSDSCVRCSWNTAPYLLVCVDVRDLSVIVSDKSAVHAWFVSDFYPRHSEKLVNFSTCKHAQTQSVRDLWVIRAWSAVWLALNTVQIYIRFL
jgi:hypothetical protein